MDRTTPLNPQLPRAGILNSDAVTPAAEDAVLVAKATKAAVEFESFFISQMLKDMRATTREMADEDSVFKDKVNQDMQDMADGLLSKQMAGQRAFGVADAILRQLLPTKITSGNI
jgi:flagellar protein FlgJ